MAETSRTPRVTPRASKTPDLKRKSRFVMLSVCNYATNRNVFGFFLTSRASLSYNKKEVEDFRQRHAAKTIWKHWKVHKEDERHRDEEVNRLKIKSKYVNSTFF